MARLSLPCCQPACLGLLTASLFLLSACTVMPTGPSVLALPGSAKSLEQFRADDRLCQDDAFAGSGGQTAQGAADASLARSAGLGTVVGGVAGAALGGRGGAGVGAGAGLLVGSTAGSAAASGSASELQRRYDFIYIQCMYGHGHRVPVVGAFPTDR